jgi:23S rRNA pseudouridine2457 synthase
MPDYYAFHKPFRVLCQFSNDGDKATLANYITDIPKDMYPVGRLDYDSEGLLLLTNDTRLNHRLLDPKFEHPRTYLVQVDGDIDDAALEQLKQGVQINIDGKMYGTKPATVSRLSEPPVIFPRNPPIRYRKEIPAPWIQLTLREGKNRQVRRMTAAVGFPTLRLIRYAIGHLTLGDLQPGQYKSLSYEIKSLIL